MRSFLSCGGPNGTDPDRHRAWLRERYSAAKKQVDHKPSKHDADQSMQLRIRMSSTGGSLQNAADVLGLEPAPGDAAPRRASSFAQNPHARAAGVQPRTRRDAEDDDDDDPKPSAVPGPKAT